MVVLACAPLLLTQFACEGPGECEGDACGRSIDAPQLAALLPSQGTLVPAFSPEVHYYSLHLPMVSGDASVALASRNNQTLSINGAYDGTGSASFTVGLDRSHFDIVVRNANNERVSYKMDVRHVATKSELSSGVIGDSLGRSLDMDRDRLIIGAQTDNSHADLNGAAYIYKHVDGQWLLESQLFAAWPAAGDSFGSDVAIDGDYAVVGAQRTSDPDSGASDAGAAYVFHYDGSEWKQTAVLRASNDDDARDGDRFGVSVDISADRIAVGALLGEVSDDVDEQNQGAAYVFQRKGTHWIEEAKFNAQPSTNAPQFGAEVALHGDTLAVSARADSLDATRGGAVYVYHFEKDRWNEGLRLVPNTLANNGDYFGNSISLTHDRLIVGAYSGDPIKAPNKKKGVVYIFERDASGWTQRATFSGSSKSADYFGHSVVIDEDFAMIGAPRETQFGIDHAGAVHLLHRDDAQWNLARTLTLDAITSGDFFGWQVALSGERFAVSRSGRANNVVFAY